MLGFGRATLWLCPLLAVSISLFAASKSSHSSSIIHSSKNEKSTTTANKTSQDPPEAILVDPVLEFGSKLLRKMGTDKNNTIFSPLVIHSALNLVLLGAKSDSETQMEDFI